MELLKQKNWWIWIPIFFVGSEVGVIVLAALLNLLNKDCWYAKWQYWVMATLCCFFPVGIMFSVFSIQCLCMAAKKLSVPGEEVYNSPYTWILCIIVPILGWTLLGIMMLYLEIWCIISLYHGHGEKTIQE